MIINSNEKYVTIGKTIFEFDNVPENNIDLKMIIHRNELYYDLSKLDAIEELTKLKIKEHFKKENKVIKMSIEELIQFSINLIKTIERYK